VVAGANAHARAELVPDAALVRGNTLLMQLEVPFAEVTALAARARSRGMRVVLNAAPAQALPESLLQDVDVLVVNEHEARICGGSNEDAQAFVERMHKAHGVACVVTLGARGALMRGAIVPAPPVQVVDSTGAGDAFAGALASALDAGAGLRDAVAAGVAAGATCCTHAGAQRAA
jgi:ribokinase